MDAWTVIETVCAGAEIIGGLILIIGPRVERSPSPRWVVTALSIAGLLFLIRGGMGAFQLKWGADLGRRHLHDLQRIGASLGGMGAGVLLTLFIAGELRLRKKE